MRKLTLTLLALMTIGWIGGCSDNPTSTVVPGEVNLEGDFGGYKPTSESPAFGDTELLADEESEQEIDDPLLGSAEVTSLTEDPDAGLFHFRAVWGQLRYDSTVTEPTDWSGSLTITRGAEIVRRLIRFEPGQDYLVERTDRQLIEWVSITTVHNDGLAVDLFIPPPKPILDSTITIEVDDQDDTTTIITVDTTFPDPVTVTFETGPYSNTFSLAELAALDTVIELENVGALALHAMQVHRVPCPGGFLAGHWGYNEDGEGRFRGRWMSYNGQVTGWLNGHFGVNENGRRVLFGKWINRAGNFEGFLKGSWQPMFGMHTDVTDETRAMGGFFARIYNADRQVIGAMQGRYRSHPEEAGGFFQARWKLGCNRIRHMHFNYNDGFDGPD